MDAKHVKGLAVVSVGEAQKIGTVARIFLDPNSHQVLGFTVDTSGRSQGVKQALNALLGEAEADPVMTGFVPAEHVRSLGPDALMVNDTTHLAKGQTDPGRETAITTDDLHKRKVVAENGTYVGQIDTVILDPGMMRATHVTVSPGLFKGVTEVPVRLVASIGPDLIVVSDEVCRRMERDQRGEEPGTRRFVVFEDGTPESQGRSEQGTQS